MRLLKTDNLTDFEFEQFYDQSLPPYAILSHTWSSNPQDEVLYSDVIEGLSSEKPAYNKVRAALLQADQHGYAYCWVDTCCIDKSSSAELSEAINSMYRWYQGAKLCYAFLEDLSEQEVSMASSTSTLIAQLGVSRWFTRGWTLQELLAPVDVRFYLKEWTGIPWNQETVHKGHLGDKTSLCAAISGVTGIPEDILNQSRGVEKSSVAQRMSWAAYRRTSRVEDEAYCLMGLFNVNMPMLYGEGNKGLGRIAFIRLQEEIIKQSDDESIFAWVRNSGYPDLDALNLFPGLLADSPRHFAGSGRILSYVSSEEQDQGTRDPHPTTWTMTPRGLSVRLSIKHAAKNVDGKRLTAVLRCYDPGIVGYIGIRLEKVKGSEYRRVDCHRFEGAYESGTPTQLFVPQTLVAASKPAPSTQVAVYVKYIGVGNVRSSPGVGNVRSSPPFQDSDYVITYAHFYGDEHISTGPLAPRWLPNPGTEGHATKLFATYLVQSEVSRSQFVLLLLLCTPSGHPERLQFRAFQTSFGSRLQPLSTYQDFDTWYEPNGDRFVWVGGESIKCISLNTTSRDLPGGRCFEVDIVVSTTGHSLDNQPANESPSAPIEQAASGAKSKTLISRLRGRAAKSDA